MKKLKTLLCIILFALICFAFLAFFSLFVNSDNPLLGYMEWSDCERISAEGTSQPLNPDDGAALQDLEDGETLRLSGRLPQMEEMPGLYSYGYLLFEYTGLDLTILLNGEVCYHSQAPCLVENFPWQLAQLPFRPEDAGGELTMLCRPLAGECYQLPLYARFSSDFTITQFNTAIADSSAFPAGALGAVVVLVCAIFFTGLAIGSPDWSLPVLALAATGNMIRWLNNISGFYFLPKRLYLALNSRILPLLIIALFLLYIWLNRKKSFWRYLGRMTVFAVPALFLGLLFLHFRGIPIAANFEHILQPPLTEADIDGALYYLCVYLTVSCTAIALYTLFRAQIRIHTENAALSFQRQLTIENYHQIEKNIHSTSLMRHEWKNQVAALHILAEQKNYEKLAEALKQMDSQLNRLAPIQYSENFPVNVILQNASARAADLGITFTASAPLPKKLNIAESDLCSLLLNMLDNALEAASKAEDVREVSILIKTSQHFLSVKCENTYADPLSPDKNGEFKSGKAEPQKHGFGIKQMRQIAAKYSGILDISYTDNRFFIQTSLSMDSD